MIGGLLGSYDSDDSGNEKDEVSSAAPVPAAQTQQSSAGAVFSKAAPAKPPPAVKCVVAADLVPEPELVAARTGGKHTSACECEDCDALMARFVAKSLQTKGIRFKCKLCTELLASKADAAEHMQDSHSSELQVFKQQKQPKLFEAPKTLKEVATAAAKKISFARDDVLGKKRKMQDAEGNFGGFAKKEKPEPPPCEQEGHQEMMHPDVITAPPWMNQPVPLSNDTEATDTEKTVDQHCLNAQAKRFTSRNVLEVKRDVVRCKLCYKTHKSIPECEKHIITEHESEFSKEQQIWHRFLYAFSKRTPPFGWECKICKLFFPTDNSTWRHIGKEVFIRKEERHANEWKEKEDRWGHEEDNECCGDGMNSGMLSMESVKAIREQEAKLAEQQQKKALADGAGGGQDDSGSEDSDVPANGGAKKSITEF